MGIPSDWSGLDTETRMRLLLAEMGNLREDLTDLRDKDIPGLRADMARLGDQVRAVVAWTTGAVLGVLLLVIASLITALLALS